MIRRVWFQEFRALRDVDVSLEPLTVIVGANSSGKTSILSGIEAVLGAARDAAGSIFRHRWAQDRTRAVSTVNPTVLGVEFSDRDPPDQFEVRLRAIIPAEEPVFGPYGYASSIRARFEGQEQRSDERPGGAYLANFSTSFRQFAESFPTAHVLRMEAPRLASAAYSTAEVPRLGADGEGLASVIADIATRSPEVLDAIVTSVRNVVPAVRRIRAVRAAVERSEQEVIEVAGQSVSFTRARTYWGHRVVVDMLNGTEISLQNAGEGTALAIGLMTYVHTMSAAGMLLIDDLDRGLHPKAQQDLVRVLRALMRERPGLQVVATTHSPFVLNELSYAEVRLTTLDDRGATLIGSLTEHPDYPRWKDHVQPGELWTSGLEEWLKRRKSPEAAA